ncbi:MAG: hypothetical protein IKE38_06175, partial [Erysipelotrichaceae bacterium]|nr:hypothetical protein [Erysipelotrichaceae bacterium]
MKKDRKKKKIIATLAATITGIGVLVSGAFASPEDVINNELNVDKAIIETGAKEVKKSSFLDKIPVFLRAVIGVPLWLVGHLIMKLVSTLLKVTLMPAWKFLIIWLVFFLIVLFIVVICIRILFPDMPLREILTKKLILSVAGGT